MARRLSEGHLQNCVPVLMQEGVRTLISQKEGEEQKSYENIFCLLAVAAEWNLFRSG